MKKIYNTQNMTFEESGDYLYFCSHEKNIGHRQLRFFCVQLGAIAAGSGGGTGVRGGAQ